MSRLAPSLQNKLSLSCSIIRACDYASESKVFQWEPEEFSSPCDTQFSIPPTLGDVGGERGTSEAISCSPCRPLIGKFGWPCLFVLVECSGLCFSGVFSTLLSHRFRGELNDNMDQVWPYVRVSPPPVRSLRSSLTVSLLPAVVFLHSGSQATDLGGPHWNLRQTGGHKYYRIMGHSVNV